MRLKDKVALVTGAAGDRGIGRGIAQALADEGAHVVVNDVTKLDKLEQRAAEFRETGVEALAAPADVSDRPSVDEMIAKTVSHFGRLDIVVSNAAVCTWEPFLEITPESIDFILGVNLRGAMNICQAGARQMVKQADGGRIIIISSVHVLMPFADMAVYGATKHVLNTLTRCLAIELAPHAKHHFRVGDMVSGHSAPAINPDLEPADYYKTAGLKVIQRARTEDLTPPPWHGMPPELEVYRWRGHRRLSAHTYAAKCADCIWDCRMAVEMIVDQWNSQQKRYRSETFCYGPKSCSLYKSGPTRKVPGRKGMVWEEEDWVDEDAVAHRTMDE